MPSGSIILSFSVSGYPLFKRVRIDFAFEHFLCGAGHIDFVVSQPLYEKVASAQMNSYLA